MTLPSTTPGTLGRVRAWMTKIAPRNHRSPMRRVKDGSLLVALLAAAAVALAGTAAAPNSHAAPPPTPRTYEVTADLDGRIAPRKDAHAAAVNFLDEGQRVPVECQTYGKSAYGSRLWDLVTNRGRTLYVPDRFIDTGTDGRAPEIRRCDSQDRVDTTPPGAPTLG
jgi:hypothetical protein